MTIRRHLPVLLAAAAAIVVGCNDSSTQVKSVPYGFLTFAAQAAGTGHTASPVGSFYSANGLSVPTANAPWDSCRLQSYSSAPGTSLGTVFPSMNAGTAIQLKTGARTDSLFPTVLATETQYRSRLASGIPYTPGDSVAAVIPGATGDGGYPAISFKAKSAEAFTVQDFGTPVAGSRIDLRWTPAQDLNGTMIFSFRFAGSGADTLSAQVLCHYRDDGTDSVPARYASSWLASGKRTWVATRVRTWVAPVSKGGYFDFISTFDLPTPVAP